MAEKFITVTLKRSMIGRKANQRACVRGLGFRRLNQTVQVLDTPDNRGMINAIRFMLDVVEEA